MTAVDAHTAAAVTLSWRRSAPPRLAAVGAGAVGIILFPAPSLSWLAWVAFVPLLQVLRTAPTAREALLRGWLGGFGFVGATLYWASPNLIYFFPFGVAVVGLLWAPWGWLVRELLGPPITTGRGLAAVALVPAGWVLVEAARSWKPFGGPWSMLGSSQWQHPAELALTAVGGVWLLTYAVMAANTAVLVAILDPRHRLIFALAAAAALLAGPLWFAAHAAPHTARTFRVALVQPGVIDGAAPRFAAEAHSTGTLPGAPVDLVVWGETSTDYLTDTPSQLAALAQLAAATGADIMVDGRARQPSGPERNTSYLVGPQGVMGQYSKNRLVMFGEYIPLRGQLGWLDRITKASGNDLTSGSGGPIVLSTAGLRVSPLVCFESAFPDMSRTATDRGAQLLVYQSADSSFQGSWEPAQHASLTAVRAAETGRPAVYSALTGVSAAYDAQGRQLAWFPKENRGSVVVAVPIAAVDTPYDRYRDYVPVVSAVGIGVWLLARSRARRRR